MIASIVLPAIVVSASGVPAGLMGDEIHAEGQYAYNGSVIEAVDTTVGPGSELTFQSMRTFDWEHHLIIYDVDVTESGVVITLDASNDVGISSVLPNEIDIVLSDLDYDGGPIGAVTVVQDGYQMIDPSTGEPMGSVEVTSDAHSITVHFPFMWGSGYEYGIPTGTHVVELEVAPAEPVGLMGDEIHAEGQYAWNGSVIEAVDTIVGPGSELTFQSMRTFDWEHHLIIYDVDVTQSGVVITLDASNDVGISSVLPNEIDIVLSDLDYDGGPIGAVTVVQDGYQMIDPSTGEPMGSVEVTSDAHSITVHFPFMWGSGYEYGIPSGTHVVELEVAPAEPVGLMGDAIHAEGQYAWNGSVIEAVDTIVGPGSELTFQSMRTFDLEHHLIIYDVDVTQSGVVITLDASNDVGISSVLPNEIDIVLSDLDYDGGPIGDVTVVQDGYQMIDPSTGEPMGSVEVTSDAHSITVHFPFMWGSGYEYGIPSGTHVVELEIAPAEPVGLMGDEIHAEGQYAWNGSVIEAVDTIVGPGSELTFQSMRTFDLEHHLIIYDVDVTQSGVVITLDASNDVGISSVLPNEIDIVLSDLDYDGGPIGDVTVVQDGYQMIDPSTGEPMGSVEVTSDAHGITVHFPFIWGSGYEYGIPSGTHVVELEIAPSPCEADYDGDSVVGFTDLTQLLAAWGPCADCPEDLDGDGAVGFTDLTQTLADWGPCP